MICSGRIPHRLSKAIYNKNKGRLRTRSNHHSLMPLIEEVQKHNSKDDCWVIIHGKAYDVSDFLGEHPGGSAIILKYAGRDATKAFDPIHPGDTLIKYLSPKYHKGEVTGKIPKKTRKPQQAQQAQQVTVPQAASQTASAKTVVDEFDVEYDEQEDKLPIQAATHAEAAPVDDEEDDEDDEDDDEDSVRRKAMRQRMPDLNQIYNLNDFEFVARHTMGKVAWGYYSSGSDDEITLRANHLAYHRIFFKPRVLVDVLSIDTATTMLGVRVNAPFYMTATALGKLGHPDGEKVLTRLAGKTGIIQMIPTLALCSFDEIVDAAIDGQTQWLQLYVNADREICRKIIEHAEQRGVKGLFITVDAPQLGRREKDMRLKNVEDLSHVQSDDNDADRLQGAARAILLFIDASLQWLDIAWFRSVTKMPIVLKGVQRVEDALLAVEHQVQGIVLSNHGGRQLEFSKPPIEVLAETMPVLRAKGVDLSKFEVYIDGGIRRASDILKALCLGAKGVGIGRPFLYAMSTYGDDGVLKLISILIDEMIMDMRLLGVTSIAQLNEAFVDVSGLGLRFLPADRLFDTVYEPMATPQFRDAKI